eukprot:9035949-Karenia_brevis.AAC.1
MQSDKCSRDDSCPFDHPDKDANYPNNVPKPPSAPNTPGKINNKRGTSPSGRKDRPPCFDHLKGNCTQGKDCAFWHPP